MFVTGNATFLNNIYADEQELTTITLEETSSEQWGVYALGEQLGEQFEALELIRIDERNW